jgi:hypothetical protein
MPGVGTVSHHRSGKNAVEEEGSFCSKTNSCRRRVWLLPRLTRSAHAVASNPGLSSATPASDCRAGNSPALHYTPSPPTELTANLNPCDFINTARLLYCYRCPRILIISLQLNSPHLTSPKQYNSNWYTIHDETTKYHKTKTTLQPLPKTLPPSLAPFRSPALYTNTHTRTHVYPLNR